MCSIMMSIYHSGTLVLEEVLTVDGHRDVLYHAVNISMRYFGFWRSVLTVGDGHRDVLHNSINASLPQPFVRLGSPYI